MSNYKYTFFDNQLIGVDQLNEITKRLVSGGISAVYSGVDFNVSDINDTNKAILTGGVVPGSDSNLRVDFLYGGKYLINPGLCFFNNGTTIEVLSGGEEIVVPQGINNYVYLVSDSNKMECYVEILQAEKQTGEFILLAVINAEGTVVDKRSYAKGKVPGFYASSENMQVNITETYLRTVENDLYDGQEFAVKIGNGNFKHLCISGGTSVFYCEFENGVAVNKSGEFVIQNGGYSTNFSTDVRISDGVLYVTLDSVGLKYGQSFSVTYHLW